MYKKLMMSVLIALGLYSGVVMGSDESFNIRFCWALEADNPDLVKDLLKRKFLSSVHAQIYFFHPYSVKIGRVSFSFPAWTRTTLLSLAVLHGAERVVDFLIDELGAKPDLISDGLAPVHLSGMVVGAYQWQIADGGDSASSCSSSPVSKATLDKAKEIMLKLAMKLRDMGVKPRTIKTQNGYSDMDLLIKYAIERRVDGISLGKGCV